MNPSADSGVPAIGLRERKKARTRAAIQACALTLFREHGYEATTVQQIAAAAEVSKSTFFRYFPTKADVVLYDNLDPLIIRAFESQPAELSLIEALRATIASVFGQLSKAQRQEQRQRTELFFSVPELRAALLDQLADGMRVLTGMIARRSGRDPDELAVRVLAGAGIGVAIAVGFELAGDPDADLGELFDRALAQFESGLPLNAPRGDA